MRGRPADQPRVRAHRRDDPLGAGELAAASRENMSATARSGRANATTPQPSTAVCELVLGETRRRGHVGSDLVLQRMARQPVAPALPAVQHGNGGACPRACRSSCGGPEAADRTALEVVLAGARPREQRLDRRELLGQRLVRGAGDRKLLGREVREVTGEPERLEGLRGRAYDA